MLAIEKDIRIKKTNIFFTTFDFLTIKMIRGFIIIKLFFVINLEINNTLKNCFILLVSVEVFVYNK